MTDRYTTRTYRKGERAPKRVEGRVCAWSGCSTKLRSTNPREYCSVHVNATAVRQKRPRIR